MYVRPISDATHTNGAMSSARRPSVRTSRAWISANSAGKIDRYAINTPAANAAVGVESPPNVVIVSTSQYSVPVKQTTPATRPSVKARRAGCGRCATATSSGASAIHANAGCPNFGKLSARKAPERSARTKSNGGRLARAHVRLEVLFLLEPPCRLIRLVAIRIAAHLDAIDRWRAGGGVEDERGIPLGREVARDGGRLTAILVRAELHDPLAGVGARGRSGRRSWSLRHGRRRLLRGRLLRGRLRRRRRRQLLARARIRLLQPFRVAQLVVLRGRRGFGRGRPARRRGFRRRRRGGRRRGGRRDR